MHSQASPQNNFIRDRAYSNPLSASNSNSSVSSPTSISTVCSLIVATLNVRGQTGLDIIKQKQIEDFIKLHNIDILHCQEIEIEESSFESCHLLASSFQIIQNNSPSNKYGTASLVRNDLSVENVNLDTNGRIITFDIENVTFCNVYLHSGNDRIMRSNRETYFAETIPQLLVNSKPSGCIAGDFNCITDKKDATRNQENKISPSLKRLIKTFSWTDSFRKLFPESVSYSRYYDSERFGEGATRIDRIYHYGSLVVEEAQYVGVAFSDHFGHIAKLSLPKRFQKIISPKTRPLFKANPDIVRDKEFKARLNNHLQILNQVRINLDIDILTWWEDFVKPSIKKLLIDRGKEVNKEKRGLLNFLLIRQAYLVRKIQQGSVQKLSELKTVQSEIQDWYSKESEKIKLQGKVEEINEPEQVRIYHHEIHQKKIQKSNILKLQVGNKIIEGHHACADHLEGLVAQLLLPPPVLDLVAQDQLLAEVEPVFTEADNSLLCKMVTKAEVYDTLCASNLHAAPGCDGITSFLYKECWDTLGDSLTELVQAIHLGQQPTKSQRTSLMVFGTKPKKSKSLNPADKRKISLLNSDFKIITGIEASRFKKVATHTLSHCQLAAGNDRRIFHGINKARDAVQVASGAKEGMGLLDNDYKAAFDYMVMLWVFKVLLAKGVDPSVIKRLRNIYEKNITQVVVNNIPGKSFINNRWSMRQGDLPSVYWFSYGIDPLLSFLEKRLQGICIYSTPVFGPPPLGMQSLPQLEERYKLFSYVDDVKPAITSMEEFLAVDRASLLFKNAPGCELHRDPNSGKVKFLPLGRWRGSLQQEDIPVRYIVLSEHLDMLGVVLKASFIQTRKTNCDDLIEKFSRIMGNWKGGKFMSLTQRPWSINTYAMPKIWFRCHCLELRAGDFSKINSSIKSWLYSDMLEKPEELVLFRPKSKGGLGVQNVKFKSLAILIKSFLETAIDPNFVNNVFHNALYRWHVLEDRSIKNPGNTPYYSQNFYSSIKQVVQEGLLNISGMTTKQWYRVLVENNVTMETIEDNRRVWSPIKCELNFPDIVWDKTWELAQLRGLDSHLSSFLFKLLHNILPTASRLHRLNQKQTPACSMCPSGSDEDRVHALLECSYNGEVNDWIAHFTHMTVPSCNASDIVNLNLHITEPMIFPLIWSLSLVLSLVWQCRVAKKTISLYSIRAEVEAKINMLRKSRLRETVPIIKNLLNL